MVAIAERLLHLHSLLVTACAALGAALMLVDTASAASVADLHHWKPVFVTPTHRPTIDPRRLAQLANAGATIPFWRSSVQSPLDGNTYSYEMVGTSPFASPASTTVAYLPIVLKVKFPGGVLLDPTKPGCNDSVSVQSRFFNSPLFTAVPLSSNGVNVGPAQITDGFQRANFWSTINGSALYHVKLSAAQAPIVLTVNAPSGSTSVGGVCSGSGHNIGEIDINAWDALVMGLINKYATPTQLPIIATYNVFETQSGSCCVLGYHNAYSRSSGEQTYSVGAYNDAGIFSVPIEDIHAWSHEIGEWMDDPFVQTDGYNHTPAWGHIGQVSGCQNNLEDGDPLTGTPYTVSLGGFTYHPQELAFFSWFYRVAATGTGGKYSFEGAFTSAQVACQ